MTENPENKWNIRFGQIFRQRLGTSDDPATAHNSSRLQDCFYFHPEEEGVVYLEKFRKAPYTPLDLVENAALYRKHFSPQVCGPTPTLNASLAKKMDTTFILIPSFGHDLLADSQAMMDGSRELIEKGFDLRYAPYPDSTASARAGAKGLAELLESWKGIKSNIVLVGYSSGILVALELLEEKDFRPLRERVKAVVSLCGAVNGRPQLNDQTGIYRKKLLDLFQKIQRLSAPPLAKDDDRDANEAPKNEPNAILDASLVKSLKELWSLDTPWAEGIWKMTELLGDISRDLIDIPPNFETLGLANSKWTEPEGYPEDCDLFSISAICPQELLLRHSDFAKKERGTLGMHLDDLFLYLASLPVYKYLTPYNDTQFLYRDTRFPPNPNRRRHHLATLKAHHWGVAFPRVLSKRFDVSFPRQALMETIVLVLAEYYGLAAH